MLSNFTFHADFGAGEIELFPANDDLVFSEEKDEDFGFFRRTLQTTLIFKGEDFETLYAVEQSGDCENHDIDIRYNGDPYYTGIAKFRTSNFKWYIDLCKVEVKLEPQDAYTCLIESWEAEIDILHPDINRETVGILTGTIENWFCVADSGDHPDYTEYVTECLPSGDEGQGWTVVNHYAANKEIPALGYIIVTSFQREAITVPCVDGTPVIPPGDGWLLALDNCPTDAKYVRPVNAVFNPSRSLDLGGPTLEPDAFFYQEYYDVVGRSFGGGALQVDNSVLLNEVLSFYPPCDGLSVASNFLDLNPSGDSPSGGPYDAPRTHSLLVWQKSDVIRAEAFENATRGIWSWLEIMQTLKVLYDVELRVVDGVLRLEHSTYWKKDEGLDLTQNPYAVFIAGKHEYEYESGTIPRRERWQFPEPVSLDFLGGPIDYACFSKDHLPEQAYLIERINTDIGYITMYPEKINDDGFVIAEGYNNSGSYSVVSRYVYPGTDLQVNGAHSIPSLIDFFHRWNRPVIQGTLLGNTETFISAKRRKKQVSLQFKLSADEYLTLNPDNLMRTQMGWGEVQSLTWSAKTCTVTVELMHE